MTTVDQLIDQRPGFFAMEPANLDAAKKINDFIYQSDGTSNAYMITTKNYRIIINTGMGFEAITHKRLFDAICNNPTSHIILTQGHVDHVGGVRYFKEELTQVIAQCNNPECQKDDQRIQSVRSSQAYIWFQKTIDKAIEIASENPEAVSQDRPLPDLMFESEHRLNVDGLEIQVFATPGGETIDSCVVWLPEHRILFSGNTFGPLFPHFPNINTVRGDKYRFIEPYLDSLKLVQALKPELLITGHFEPIHGEQLIHDSLERLYKAVDYVHRETLSGMNSGIDIFTLMKTIQLPVELRVGEGYGKVSWAVRTLWESYMGWFKAQSTSELYATRVNEIYADIAEITGLEQLLKRGRDYLQQGDVEKALHFAEIALEANQADIDSLSFYKDCINSLQERSGNSNFWEEGWLQNEIRKTDKKIGS